MTLAEITIRKLKESEIPAAKELAWKVFSVYESPDYSAEGTAEFRKCLDDENYLSGIEYCGAFDGKKLIGEIGIRAEKSISAFSGLSKKLFSTNCQTSRKYAGSRIFDPKLYTDTARGRKGG